MIAPRLPQQRPCSSWRTGHTLASYLKRQLPPEGHHLCKLAVNRIRCGQALDELNIMTFQNAYQLADKEPAMRRAPENPASEG